MVFISLVVFFVVVAGVNAIMVRAAVSTFGGLDTENAYQAGLAYTREADAVRAQDALHWQIGAKVSLATNGAKLVEVVAADVAGQPLDGLRATARLVRPADKRAGHDLALSEIVPGTYRGTSEAEAGQWDLLIELSRDNARLFLSKNRILLK
jgi:nitrogen fixation protein FixH